MTQTRAIIIGAGAAGLTAGYELLTRTGIKPIGLEKSTHMGGIPRTVNYKGNRIDIDGHRFFSKSDRVMEWWLQMLALQASEDGPVAIKYHRMEREIAPSPSRPDLAVADTVMLVRACKSPIYYLRRFFDYLISLSTDTLLKLGLWRTFKIGMSYVQSALFPFKQEETLEQFFINRSSGNYTARFSSPTRRRSGAYRCDRISAEWGAQRIKGLSVWSTLMHALRKVFKGGGGDIGQKSTETLTQRSYGWKRHPVYFGTYHRLAEIREDVDRYENLFLIGRNGMHRYNNQDHSMLTAMMAVDNIVAGKTDKTGLWEVNTEMDYHEEKGGSM